MTTTEVCLEQLRNEELGDGIPLQTPFGTRCLYYSDYTASGRHVRAVEEWVRAIHPYYANSHTVISTTGRMMTELREEARQVIARSVHASTDDVVMFVGSGATAAINKLVGLLWLDLPNPEYGDFVAANLPREKRPVVIVGPYEHHSNQLPWVESVAEVIEVGEAANGQVSLEDLDSKLRSLGRRPLVIGSFSAASNVTGILSDVPAIARILHAYGALAFFDYAACGPYSPIDMHPDGDLGAAVDALYVSAHKFAGGPQASGVLIANRKCFRRTTPERPGGGTVDYVSYFGEHHIDYVHRLDEREEGGTPAILGDIRAGLAFAVKDGLNPKELLNHETEVAEEAFNRLSKHSQIKLLGARHARRLPILSFNVEGLHHALVAALLDDLFGIQSRAGCSCAGPYGHRLLGVGPEQSLAFRKWIVQGVNGIKPGWVRVTLSPYATPADREFVLRAIEFVADHGKKFVGEYELDWRDGIWRHVNFTPAPPPVRISAEEIFRATAREAPIAAARGADLEVERARYFVEAQAAASKAEASANGLPEHRTGIAGIDSLIWFRCLRGTGVPVA